MDLYEIGGACEVDQLLSFGWLPNKALHFGCKDDIYLVPPNELDQASKIGTLFLGVLGCADIIFFKR
jgi:hypothetical protein